jgi:spore coat polysaccharide biosynthesis protein SpsF (cytidylyltransferase family)
LGHVIARCIEAGITPIVCTSTEIDDDKIEEYCQQNSVRVFRGSLVNKIERWNQCAIKNNVRFFHTVDCDDPFFDPDQVKESLNKLTSEELDIVFPTKISSNGAASVGYSIRTTILTPILEDIVGDIDAEMVDVIFENHRGAAMDTLVSNYPEFENVRLTLDYLEDYILLSSIRLLTNTSVSRQEISHLLASNPDLMRINWFRNEQWSANQEKIRERIKAKI